MKGCYGIAVAGYAAAMMFSLMGEVPAGLLSAGLGAALAAGLFIYRTRFLPRRDPPIEPA
jgi:hypothetical protein